MGPLPLSKVLNFWCPTALRRGRAFVWGEQCQANIYYTKQQLAFQLCHENGAEKVVERAKRLRNSHDEIHLIKRNLEVKADSNNTWEQLC